VSLSQRGKKISGHSHILHRDFHVDHFVPDTDTPPCFQLVLFGGSGMGEAEYMNRAESVVPVFNQYLDELEKEWLDTPFCFTYITAPFDIGFRKMAADEEMREKWTAHIKDEVLPTLLDLPMYWIGYSGGLILGWYGMGEDERCFGGSALGGDQVSEDFYCPPQWQEELRLYYNPHDLVYRANRSVIDQLVANGEAACFKTRFGSHNLVDYLKNESFCGLARRAAACFREKYGLGG